MILHFEEKDMHEYENKFLFKKGHESLKGDSSTAQQFLLSLAPSIAKLILAQ